MKRSSGKRSASTQNNGLNPTILQVRKHLQQKTQQEQHRSSHRLIQEANRLKRLPLYLFTILDELKSQAQARGIDVIDLGMGNPDLPPPKHVVDEMVKQIKKPENHGYSRKGGDAEKKLNEAIATWYDRKFKVKLDPVSEEGIQAAMMSAGLDLLYARGDPNGAAAEFRKVLERNPAHYGATFQLATALDRAGKRKEARPLWEKMLKMAEAANDKETLKTVRDRVGRAP